MKEVILDGAQISTLAELHARLAELLELPDHYGANLDALWDALTGWVTLPLTIYWVHYEECSQRLGEKCARVLQVLREAEEEQIGLKVIVKNGL